MIRTLACRLAATALLGGLLLAPGAASAAADGPDWFRVTGVASNDVLNVREQAGARHRKVGELPSNANGIRNLGCIGGLSYEQWQRATASERAAAANKRWCKVAWRGVEGWVAGRFLAEGSRPAAGGGSGGGGGGIAVRDMERYCRGEASSTFGVRPPRIRTNAPERRANGAHSVFGDYDGRGSRVIAFECRFDPRGQFNWVRETGGGAATRPPSGGEPGTSTERVRFPAGGTGTEITRTLAPGASTRFVLGARNLQNLYVRVAPRNGRLDYQIYNPDRSFLLEMTPAAREYRGQLWQNGDHVIEVINRGNTATTYNLIVGLN